MGSRELANTLRMKSSKRRTVYQRENSALIRVVNVREENQTLRR